MQWLGSCSWNRPSRLFLLLFTNASLHWSSCWRTPFNLLTSWALSLARLWILLPSSQTMPLCCTRSWSPPSWSLQKTLIILLTLTSAGPSPSSPLSCSSTDSKPRSIAQNLKHKSFTSLLSCWSTQRSLNSLRSCWTKWKTLLSNTPKPSQTSTGAIRTNCFSAPHHFSGLLTLRLPDPQWLASSTFISSFIPTSVISPVL